VATLLERVSETRHDLRERRAAFRAALQAARVSHSWREISEAAGLPRSTIRDIVSGRTKGDK